LARLSGWEIVEGVDAMPESPPSSLQHDAEYWRLRAEEALEVAYEMTNPDALSRMLGIGKRYERLARLAEERLRHAEPSRQQARSGG